MNGPDVDPTEPCDVCRRDPAECRCPECSCGEAGNPNCYEKHMLAVPTWVVDDLLEAHKKIAAATAEWQVRMEELSAVKEQLRHSQDSLTTSMNNHARTRAKLEDLEAELAGRDEAIRQAMEVLGEVAPNKS